MPATDHARIARSVCRAEDSIAAYEKTGAGDREDSLCDLLADLMHWASATGTDFGHELERARLHYRAEATGRE